MTKDNVIGLGGTIPWHYSEDQKRFKRITMNTTIIMGRLTWESINCKVLPGRRNVVISRNPVNGVEHYDSLQSALDTCNDQDTWVIGGGQIYNAAFEWVTRLDITYVPDQINREDAVRFPCIDPLVWQAAETTQIENSPLSNIIYHKR